MEQIARLYWKLTEIESAFRSMKSDLSMRPIDHNKDAHMEAYLFLSVLALLYRLYDPIPTQR